MYKRNVFTTITPLPSYMTRETVVETLHDHKEMIQLNPLVTNFTQCRAPPFAPADEFHCIWYELTDRISYLPGGIIQGNISYKACFYDLPRGLQTHVYAPTGLDIQDKWSVCGNMPGEEREPVELGLPDAPREGLYLREDVNMRCQIWSTGFVKKTLKKAHMVLVDRLVLRADLEKQKRMSTMSDVSALSPRTAFSDAGSSSRKEMDVPSGKGAAEMPAPLQVGPRSARGSRTWEGMQPELHFSQDTQPLQTKPSHRQTYELE